MPYSTTSSARASSAGGTLRPIALAAFRLTTTSYLLGACTGRFPGFSHLKRNARASRLLHFFRSSLRNEILALRWSDLDAEKKSLRIERALEETDAHGIRFKGPKKDSHKRTITIDDDLLAMLLAERDKHLRIVAGIAPSATVDLSLIKLPKDAFMFPHLGADLSFVAPRRPRDITKAFAAKAKKLGFPIRLHDLRGTHETLLLDAGVPLTTVAERCGHDPVTLLRNYAKRTRRADTSAASVIGVISKGILG